MERLIAATDGSSLGSPGPSGWAWAISEDPALYIADWGSAGIGHGTANRAELTALVELLRHVPHNRQLEVRVDSQYTINVATKWRHGWRRNGWCKRDGSPLSNCELIQTLDQLLNGRDIRFEWVKAHLAREHGDPLNFFVDKAARNAAREQTSAGLALPPEATA